MIFFCQLEVGSLDLRLGGALRDTQLVVKIVIAGAQNLRGAEILSLRLYESVIALYVVLGDFRKHKLSH